ncbi:MAG: TonB-dependent receptor plug domain-containing protein, partial [Kangiellaceae bacterium]
MTNNFKVKGLVLAMGMTFASTPVFAADDAAADEDVQTMVIVGSRAAPRSIGDSPVPVDVISAEEMSANGTADMTQLMATVAPSFNVNAQPISDAATMVRPANLRGLSPDSTLILVNGKRRHRSAVIAFLGGGISDGAQGPDISVIPAVALKQVEILRDGAAAQYGSDAIAGVINFVLKDNSDGGMVEVKYGEYDEGDGQQVTIAGNLGLPLTERGFVNFSYELNNQDATNRSVQRGDAAALRAGPAGGQPNLDVNDPAQIWGAPNVNDDQKIFMNVGLELDNNSEAYMFGNWAEREVDGGFFYRNPHNRGAVNSADGGTTLLIGDLDPDDGVDCQAFNVPVPTDGTNVRDTAAYQAVPFATYGDPSSGACWAFNELFPGGFTPRFGGDVTDVSLVMGTRGTFSGGTTYDFSGSIGQNQADF